MPELNSWKEIAQYLDVSVRTAQSWEALRGLPVQRTPGPRGRVWATTEALDAWKRAGNATETESESVRPVFRPPVKLWWVAALGLVVTGGIIIGRQTDPPREFGPLDPLPLTSDAGQERKPQLSPDSESVAYLQVHEETQKAQLVVRHIPTGSIDVLQDSVGPESSAHWSPNGKSIAMAVTRGDEASILITETAAPRTIKPLLRLRGADRAGNVMESLRVAWSSDNRHICAADRDDAGGPLSLYFVDIATGARRRLTNPPAGTAGDVQCTPSPDGKSIAFARYRTFSEADIHILDLSSNEVRPFTKWNSRIVGMAWLPDSQTIIAGSTAGGPLLSLWQIIRPDIEPRRLTGKELPAKNPAIAPYAGGIRIVYETSHQDTNIWRWTAGKGIEQVTRSNRRDSHPAISNRGQLAWVSWQSGSPEIWVAAETPQSAVKVTHFKGAYIDFPKWSPDGTTLTFSAPEGANRDIRRLTIVDSSMRELLWVTSEEGRPSFSSNGNYIYFRSDRSGTPQIWRADQTDLVAETNMPIQITRAGGYEALESPDGSAIYYIREREKPGLWRQGLSGGEPVLVDPETSEGRWTLASEGIYILNHKSAPPRVEFRGWRDNARRVLFELAPGRPPETGLAVTRDGKTIYWSQLDRSEGDLMMALVR